MEHFIFVRTNVDKKALIILDGHTTHTKNLEVINLARANGIVLLSLPAHTTHRLQPCDVSFFKPLNTYYSQSADKWLRPHPNQNITQFQESTLLDEAYARVATLGKAVNGFAKCGIYLLDRNVFQDLDFVCVETIERPDLDNAQNDTNVNGPDNKVRSSSCVSFTGCIHIERARQHRQKRCS